MQYEAPDTYIKIMDSARYLDSHGEDGQVWLSALPILDLARHLNQAATLGDKEAVTYIQDAIQTQGIRDKYRGKEMGRNINYDDSLGKYVIFTIVDGKVKLEECDTKALAQSRFNHLRNNGYQYIDPHKDISI